MTDVLTAELVARAQVLAVPGHRRILGITGAPGAGKSTVAQALLEALGPAVVAVVPMDGFHDTNEVLLRLGRRDRKGAPDTFDAMGYAALLGRLRANAEPVIHAPDFDRELDEPVAGAIAVGRSIPLVVTEGNYLLTSQGSWPAVHALLDEVWYVELDEAVRLERLIARHVRHGTSRAAATAWARGTDQRNAALIAEGRDRADVVVRLDAAPDPPAVAGAATMAEGSTDGGVVRAAVIERSGVAPVTESLSLDEPRAGEVRVRMTASGVCHSDLHVRDGDWARPGPIVMGHEGAGVIEAVGAGVDPALAGRSVALSWLVPCGSCTHCRRGREWACSESSSLGHAMADGTTRLARDDGSPVLAYCGIGTMAEAAVVPVGAAIPLPDGVPGEVGALIGCCVSTGVGAVVKTAGVEAGSSVAVIGLGGVGLSAVMGAVLAGASRIVAVDVAPAKLELARELGATDAVLAGDDPGATIAAVRDATGGGPDYAVEAIGRVPTIELAVAMLPPGGTAVLVGMTAFGALASFEVFPFVDGGRRIIGSNYGSSVAAVDFPRYAQLYLDGRLPVERLIDRRIGLEDLESAFDRLRRGEGHRQVIVF